MNRSFLYDIIKIGEDKTRAGKCYDIVIMIAVILSLVPLTFKPEQEPQWAIFLEHATVAIFIFDYIVRWITADFKYKQDGLLAFAKYPFSVLAIIDLLCILPSFMHFLSNGLIILRLGRVFRVIRALKILRYSKSVRIIIAVLKNSKDSLLAVAGLAIVYILVSALLIFQVENEKFPSFFEAVYWACISLTTVGYGDIVCETVIGRVVTMLSSALGVAIIALPAGIVTAGYMKALDEEEKS